MDVVAAIAIGSNLGDRARNIEVAASGLAGLARTELIAISRAFETDAVGPAQPRYLNAAATIRTGLGAEELLAGLMGIERACGRTRPDAVRWGPRTMDLDLLIYGGELIESPTLSVPHPRMKERLFVLEPLAEIAPEMWVPGVGATVVQLLTALRGA